MNATTKGVEAVDGGFVVFVERHEPCVALHETDHSQCTVRQRFVADHVFSTLEAAIAAADQVEVDGISDFERTGS